MRAGGGVLVCCDNLCDLTVLQICFTLPLPGFAAAGRADMDKARCDLGVTVEQCVGGRAGWQVRAIQEPAAGEHDIVTRAVERADKLWRQDKELQSKLGVKLNI